MVEPNVFEHNAFRVRNLGEAYKNTDIIVYLVSHDEFREVPHDPTKVILDFCGINKK